MRLPPQPPANDNGTPIAFPVFPELLRRHDLTQTDVLVYGALLVLARGDRQPAVADVAATIGRRRTGEHKQLRAAIRKLESAGLFKREFVRGKPSRYVALGPIASCG